MFPFIFANSPFPCISATFLNNIFCDMSTFSSFLNYVTALVQLLHLTYNKQLEKVRKSSFRRNALLTCHTNTQLPIICCFSHKVNFKVFIIRRRKKPHRP